MKILLFTLPVLLLLTGCLAPSERPGYKVEVISDFVEGEEPEEEPVAQEPEKPKEPEKESGLSELDQAIAEEVLKLLDSARDKYRKDRDAQGAIKYLNEALSLMPHEALEAQVRRDLSTLYTLYALTHAHQKKFEQAMPFFKKAIETDPKHAFAYMEYGATLWKTGKVDEALKAYDKAIENKPDYYQALNARGLIKMNQGKHEEALKDFEKALEVQPDFFWAIINKGLIIEKAGKIEDAIKLYDKAIQLSPKTGLAYNNRGWACYKLKKYGQAIRDLTKALKYSPELDIAYLNRASAYAEDGLMHKAIKDYESFLDRFPRHPRAQKVREWLEKNKGRFEEEPAQEHDK